MLDFLLFAVAVAVPLVAFVFYLYPGSSRRTTIPGIDPSNEKDGNLGDIKNAGSIHEFLREMHASYGPITSFYWGQQLTVSIASPELFKEHSKVFGRPAEIFRMFEPLLTKHSIQYANGADGRARRKKYDTVFTHTAMMKYYSILEENTKELAGRLSAIPKDEVIPLMEYMVTFAIKAISMVGFGDFMDGENCKKMMHSYNLCWDEMEERLGGDIPEPGDPRHELLETEREKIYELCRGAFKHRKAHPGGTEDLHLIDTIMESGLSEAAQLADALSCMIAGFHTTGTMLTWLFYYLATHRDVEEKLLREIKDVLKGEGVTPANRVDLVYMKQVLDETLRCSQLAPFTARFQDMDSEMGGHVIPAKTPVIHALGVVLHDENYWPDPEKFDPDRFKDEPANFYFEPFGFGMRKCPACHFAYLEVMIVLSILLPKFKFSIQDGQVIVPTYGLVTKPSDEIWVTVEKRK